MRAMLFGVLLLSGLSFMANAQDRVGGGGDASEDRVNEIRADLMSWIKKGGSKELELPSEITLEEYNQKMIEILSPKGVLITFVEKDDLTNEELQVVVDGKPKTCRGFISRFDNMPNILCNISRFKDTSDSSQYRLIHHEYAGLAGLEKNEGASSDYVISNQITDFLVEKTVLKLAVRENKPVVRSGMKINLSSVFFTGANVKQLQRKLARKGYIISNSSEAEVGIQLNSIIRVTNCPLRDVYSEEGISRPCNTIQTRISYYYNGQEIYSQAYPRILTTDEIFDHILIQLAKIK